MKAMGCKYIWVYVFVSCISQITGLLDPGIFDVNFTGPSQDLVISKKLYKNAQIFIQINCESPIHRQSSVNITFLISQSDCLDSSKVASYMNQMLNSPSLADNNVQYQFSGKFPCNDRITLDAIDLKDETSHKPSHSPVYRTERDGVFVLGFLVQTNGTEDTVGVHFDIRNDYGYLSATDWPLLPFYGFMCAFYVLLGVIWLILSFMQWRDLLRVQFWIGAVIFLGMLEKATFFAFYQTINETGSSVQGAELFAEWVSCAKRTLARMLVIIVSLGFGIVKPRLGSTLHRVVGTGLLYFFLAASEAYMRIVQSKNDSTRDLLVAQVPLAVLDSAICWWIFSALVNTTRTLRLRRNETKLALYRHFTNTLIFSVVASVFFMLYCIKAHKYVVCLKNWKDMWIETAFWHILFSALLLVIMILWRPTNNNQRYAFVPLLDTGDDEDEEEEERLVSDAYGVKVRIHHPKTTTNQSRNSVEDDLKWLEENVKSEATLPILDSDEELVNTRFEVSKMQ